MSFKTMPPVGVPEDDMRRLRRLALHAMKDADPIARFLLTELDRAQIYDAGNVPDDIVRINHWVTFRVSGAEQVESRILALPEDCLNSGLHLSVISPTGAALLGLRPGTEMTYLDDDGRAQTASVVSLQPPGNISFFRPGLKKPATRSASQFDSSPDPDPGPSAA